MNNAFVAVIPARSGSKRVPNKNIRKLGNVELIVWSIQAAMKSKKLSDVLVSTDSELIAKISVRRGAKVLGLRPVELASDKSPTVDSIEHAAKLWEKNTGISPEAIITLPPTSPFRTPGQIDDAINLYTSNTKCSSVISCMQIPQNMNIHKQMQILNSGFLKPQLEDKWGNEEIIISENVARNGPSICVTKYPFATRNLYQNPAIPFIMNNPFNLDINTEWDFLNAQAMLEYSKELRNLEKKLGLNKS